MPERRIAITIRQDLQALLLAVAAFMMSICLCIGINWFFYSDYSQQRVLRETEEIRRRVMCTELRAKRDAHPNDIYIARDYKKCTINRSSVGTRA